MPRESVTIEVEIVRPSSDPDVFEHSFAVVTVPESVTEDFREFLRDHIGFDPKQEAGADVVASLDDLPSEVRGE